MGTHLTSKMTSERRKKSCAVGSVQMVKHHLESSLGNRKSCELECDTTVIVKYAETRYSIIFLAWCVLTTHCLEPPLVRQISPQSSKRPNKKTRLEPMIHWGPAEAFRKGTGQLH